VLHIRVYDPQGRHLFDRDEIQLLEQTGPLLLHREQPDGLWPPRALTRQERQGVLAAVAPVVGLTLDDYAQLNMALESYYAGKVEAASQDDPLLERRVRDWIDRRLITFSAARALILSEGARTQGLNDEVIRRLVNDYLTRTEVRRDQTYYQLAHDRLVEPIRKNNREWFAHNQPALIRDYNDAVAASGGGDLRVERALRDWFDRRPGTPSGDRDWARKGDTPDDAATNALIDGLTECSLHHVIPRDGELWSELGSDRLITPILKVNADWRKRALHPFQIRAEHWYCEDRPGNHLLGESELEAAEGWVKTHGADCLPREREFLRASREAIHAEQRTLDQRQAVNLAMDRALSGRRGATSAWACSTSPRTSRSWSSTSRSWRDTARSSGAGAARSTRSRACSSTITGSWHSRSAPTGSGSSPGAMTARPDSGRSTPAGAAAPTPMRTRSSPWRSPRGAIWSSRPASTARPGSGAPGAGTS
jgi:hypothetical protein